MFFFENKQIFLQHLDMAKKVISKTGAIFPLIYPTVLGDDNKIYTIAQPVMLLFGTDEQRLEACNNAGMYCKREDADGVIIVSSMRLRKFKGMKPEDLEYIMKNYDTERPSVYPDSMVENTITIMYIDFENEENMLTLMCSYVKEDDKFKYNKYEVVNNALVINGIVQPLKDGYNAYIPGTDIKGLKNDV